MSASTERAVSINISLVGARRKERQRTVALCDLIQLPVRHLARREGAARGHERLPVRPLIRLLGCDLDEPRRVRQREDDRPLGPLRHLAHDLLRERPRVRGAPDEHRRAHLADDVEEADLALVIRRHVRPLCVGAHELAQGRADLVGPERLLDESVAVEEVEALVGIRGGERVDSAHAVPELLGDSKTGGTCTVDDDALLGELALRDADSAHERSESHGASTLTRGKYAYIEQKELLIRQRWTHTSSLNTACLSRYMSSKR